MFTLKIISKSSLRKFLAIPVIIALALSGTFLLPNAQPVEAAATLTITPITWNVIGLDSNNVDVGPNNFPVGVRVCNEGTTSPADDASGVIVDFVWDDGLADYNGNTYINLRSGSLSMIEVGDLAAGDCYDAYFEVTVTRDSDAYNKTRRYHITADSDQTNLISTPRPREIFVEYLVSQSRNYNMDVKYSTTGLTGSFSSVPAGGSMTLMVGGTYWIELDAKTATNGYEQIESFINFPNTVFQVLAVTTTYSADTSANIPAPDDKLYGDGCTWENNPNDPSYRSCLGVGKAGGDIVVIYKVKILSVPSINPEPLNAMIYDFSGSSYHYNSDYAVSVRYGNIVNASITKSFNPKLIAPGGTSTLTFTITNPGPQAISDVNFSDNLTLLQAGMSIASTTVTPSGCGTPTSNPSPLAVGTTSFSFSNITVNALSTCTIAVTVTVASNGTYNNQSGNLYIGTNDTGSYATDALVANSKPAAPSSCGTATRDLATWNLSNYTASTSTNNGPFNYSSKQGDVNGTATYATYGSITGSSSAIVNTTTYPTGWSAPGSGSNDGNSWGIRSGWLGSNPADPLTANTPYFQFQVDASNYGGIGIVASYDLQGNWSNAGNYYVLFSTNGTSWSTLYSTTWKRTNGGNTWEVGGLSATSNVTGNATVYFRVFFAGSGNDTAVAYLDTIRITGCPRPNDPTLSKAFSPTTIAQGSASTLTFTFTNPNSSALTGVNFSDTLPAGLVIADPSGLTTPSCTGGTIASQVITATVGTTSITMTGATITPTSPNTSVPCSFSVNVLGSVAGSYTNISSSISSTETGPNYTSYGTSNLTVIAPPVIAKQFGANNLITGNTTTLAFSISNPNLATTLTGISFTDTLPAGLDVAASSSSVCGGTLTTNNLNPDTVVLSGGSLAAGASCTFSVTITGSTEGLKENSVQVSSTNGGTGNTATANILVRSETPKISIMKQVGLTNDLDGDWYSSKLLTTEGSVYYKFTVENTGDVNFTSFNVTDPTLQALGFGNPLTCTWYQANTYPTPGYSAMSGSTLLAASNGDPTAYCVVGPVTTQSGFNPNTATAHGTYDSTDYTSTDTASYMKGGNFGHLPYSAYPSLNVFDEGGAMHVNDAGTTLGGSVTTTWLDGSTSDTYSTRTTDDGIEADHTQWAVGAGNKISVTVTCNVPTCYVYGWFDWNKDGDFDDAGETLLELQFTEAGVHTLPLEFSIPAGTSLVGDFYSRFRVYSDLPANPSPYGLAVDASGNALGGEIEDYKWPYAPTAVTLSLFNASAIYGQVTLNWITELEYNTVGYNLYRAASPDGEQVKVNSAIIPSLLLMGKTPPFEYLFVDSNILPGVTYFYWLEEIATDGKEFYGPIQVTTPPYGVFLPLMRR